jgi:hypothetical protein
LTNSKANASRTCPKIAIGYEEGPKKLFWSRQEITYPVNGRKPDHNSSTKT